jgi:hypothetical protein
MVLSGRDGVVLLPAVPAYGLPIVPGDTIEIFSEAHGREEVVLLGLEPQKGDPSSVRLRIGGRAHLAPGVEVWPGENQSRVVTKPRPEASLAAASRKVTLAGGLAPQSSRRR